jgi:4-amino-4-deoxy-L-arabinose transferase-like glycosyltransferase
MPRPRPTATAFALVILAAAGLYLAGNARVALWDRDEPRYAQTSRQMLQSGDWVVPRLLDEVRTAKPVFIYWCQAAAMAALGDTAFAARLPSVVGMTLTLVLLAVVLSRAVGRRRALWTVVVLATSGLSIAAAKMCLTDAVLLLFVTTAQLCLYAVWRGRATWPVVVTWAVATGLAGLTKGPVVLGIQLMTLAALWTISRIDAWVARRRGPGAPRAAGNSLPVLPYEEARAGEPPVARVVAKALVAILIVAAIVGPWLYLIHQREPTFLGTTLGHDVLRRAVKPLEGHRGPPGYYLLTIWGTFFPWSLLLLTGLTVGWRHRDLPPTRFALAAVAGPWVLMELVQTKLPHYLLPVFPPLALLVADALVRCIRRQHDDLVRRRFVAMTAAWSIVVVLLGASPWLTLVAFPVSGSAVNAMTVLLAVSMAWAWLVLRHVTRRRLAAMAATLGGGMAVAIAVICAWLLPELDFLRLSPRIAAALVREGATRPGDVRAIGYKEPSLAFYQGGTLRNESENAFLVTHPPERWPRWVVVRDDVWQQMPPEVLEHLDVVETFRGIAYADDPRVIEVVVARKK